MAPPAVLRHIRNGRGPPSALFMLQPRKFHQDNCPTGPPLGAGWPAGQESRHSTFAEAGEHRVGGDLFGDAALDRLAEMVSHDVTVTRFGRQQ
jgi:hypothetical protein